MAMSPSEEGEGYRTSNLTLATYLVMGGHSYSIESAGTNKRGQPIAAWLFEHSAALVTAVKEFDCYEARVEPRRFHNQMSQTRREVIDYLDQHESSH